MDIAPVPITVTLGESIFAVAARTPGLFNTAVMLDDTPAMIDKPLQITVVVNGQALSLPPTEFASIGQMAGVVTDLHTAPMRRYVDLAHSRELAIALVRDAARQGWTVTIRRPMEMARLQADLDEPGRSQFDRYVKQVAMLERGDTELEVTIEEASGAGLEDRVPPAHGNLFLVQTDFRAPRIDEAQTKLLFARRKELNAGTNSMPLSVWAPPR